MQSAKEHSDVGRGEGGGQINLNRRKTNREDAFWVRLTQH